MAEHTPGYRITEDGRVFSVAHNWRGYGEREMSQTPNASGYPSVRVTIDGKRKRVPVHRLVATEFHGPQPTVAHEVRHLDGDKTNNHASNLAWGTRRENTDDRAAHGRTSSGPAHSEAIKRGIAASDNTYWRHAR